MASKWGHRCTAGWRVDADTHEVKEHTRPHLEHQLAETRELLGPWLRLHQVHSLTPDSPLWSDQALLRRLAGLRAEGLELGFSTSGPDQADVVRRGLALTAGGEPLLTSVQSTWNLLEPSAGDALAEAHAGGVRVVVKEALANGRLTDRGGPVAAELGPAAPGSGADAVALAAVLAQPWCDVVLSGAVTVAQLKSNASAPTLVAGLDLAEVSGRVPPEPAAGYWVARSRLPWS